MVDFKETYPYLDLGFFNTLYAHTDDVSLSLLTVGEESGIWMRWIDERHPPLECVKRLGLADHTSGPAMLIGREGSEVPVMALDLVCLEFHGAEEGFNFAWLGADLQLPRLKDVWSPNAVGFNAFQGSVFDLETEVFDYRYCTKIIDLGPFPVSLGMALFLAIVLMSFSLGVYLRKTFYKVFCETRVLR